MNPRTLNKYGYPDSARAKPMTEKTETPKPAEKPAEAPKAEKPTEVGGPKGPEPTRYQDWERGGRCVDF